MRTVFHFSFDFGCSIKYLTKESDIQPYVFFVFHILFVLEQSCQEGEEEGRRLPPRFLPNLPAPIESATNMWITIMMSRKRMRLLVTMTSLLNLSETYYTWMMVDDDT